MHDDMYYKLDTLAYVFVIPWAYSSILISIFQHSV